MLTAQNIAGEIKLKYEVIQPQDEQVFHDLDMSKLFWKVWNLDEIGYQEHCWAIFFNQAMYPIGYFKVGEGSINQCIVDVRRIMSAALLCGATAFCVAHNHPSGNLSPSSQDISLCKKLQKAGEIMDINLIDFLILSPNGTYSSFVKKRLDMNKSKFYFSLCSGQVHLVGQTAWGPNGLLCVEANDMQTARDYMFRKFGDNWGFCYPESENDFETDLAPYFPEGIVKTVSV
ncbi:MAG: JAB domain-containing protein [Notoacmeibacter sp.]